MIVLRLVVVFIFSALLTACPVSEDKQDVKSLKAEVSAVKDEVKALALKTRILDYIKPPCNPPGTHSEISCFYRLKITQVIGNGQFKGRVRDEDITEENKDCPKPGHSTDPSKCAKGGDNREHGPFTVDGATPAVGDVVEFLSDPTNDHLKKK